MAIKGPAVASEERKPLLLDEPLAAEDDLSRTGDVAADARRTRRKRVVLRHLKIFVAAAIALAFIAFWRGAFKCALRRMDWPGCSHRYSTDFNFDFDDPGDFNFEEIIQFSDGFNTQIHSDIQLRPAASDASHDINVRVTVKSNKADVLQLPESQRSNNALSFTVNVPRDYKRLCLEVNAEIFVKAGTTLSKLNIFSNIAALHILPGLGDVKVGNTTIQLGAGSVSAEPLNSRETYIRTRSGSVRGDFSIYDLLSIHSHSGSVHVDVTPQDADEEKPMPAKLLVGTESGSVDIKYPPHGASIPERYYEAHISTRSGSIRGQYLHGTATTMETRSGSITVDVLPYAADSYPSSFDTSTTQGSQRITVLRPHSDRELAIKRLNSSHVSQSGSLHLDYPQEWEGQLEGSTKVGHLVVGGDGVRIIENGRDGPVGAWVKADKGDGESDMRFSSAYGSINVHFGNAL